MAESSRIFGRAWLYGTGDPFEVQIWHHSLEPMTIDRRSIDDWAREHFSECYDEAQLREKFGIPECGAFQVLFKGALEGSLGHDGEWDEWFDVEEVSHETIPADYLNCVLSNDKEVSEES